MAKTINQKTYNHHAFISIMPYQNASEIKETSVRAQYEGFREIAGVRPEDLNVSITRDMVTIHGHREEAHEVTENDYFSRELYWGSFSRNILLPQEVDVEGAEASEKHGLLTIKLPKLDKHRETKLKVKSN